MTESGAFPARIYSALIANSNDCITVLAADGRTVFQSPNITAQLGYRPEDLVGRNNFDLIHPDDQAAALERFRAVLAGTSPGTPLCLRFRHNDGRWRLLQFTASRLIDQPDEPLVVLHARDITAMTETTAALRASEHRLDLALELGAMGVSEFDYRTGSLIFSTSFTRLMGYDAAPPDSAMAWFIGHIHADDRARVASTIDAVFQSPPTVDESEVLFRLIRRDGETRWWSGRSRVMRDDEGKPTYAIGLVTDVTERRHLEEQAQQAQKLEAIGRLAGGVAHDFNNLLTVISGYAETLMATLTPADPAFGDLLEIRHAADRAALLTQQLLAFSRKQVLRPEIVDANLVVRDIATMIGRLIVGAIQLTVDLAKRPAPVLADRGQLEQVLINLVVNARDAMPDGGTLTMRTRVVQVTAEDAVRLYPIKPGMYVRLSVCDTGMGMSPEVQARVFEPFFTTKEPGKGTGIGLSSVYGIIKQSGGFIFLSSEPGQGTTFDVYFPLSEALASDGAPAEEQEAPPDAQPARGVTVLLVEDYSRVRLLARKVLARQGYRVLTAQSGHEALAVAHAHEGAIDVLVTDVVMPGMSGPELARQLHESHPETAVVYMSGYAGDVLVRQGLDPEVAHFLEKPFTPGALSRKVREVLALNMGRR